jgi:lysophospholipid acyltransferase (LPLAT)-like uncharacterized protein
MTRGHRPRAYNAFGSSPPPRARASDRVAHGLMACFGVAVGLLARLWLSTLRVHVTVDPRLIGKNGDMPWVMGFWHGRQWPLFAYRRRRATVVLVSHSLDGSLQARALALQGLRVVRGSSSRGGAKGLVRVVRRLRDGLDAAFAVDGPRGPLGVVKGGVVTAARHAGAWLVPVGAAVERGLVLERAWDRYFIAWPFSRVSVVMGAPIDPLLSNAREELETAIRHANAAAESRFALPSVKRGKGGDSVDLDPRSAR